MISRMKKKEAKLPTEDSRVIRDEGRLNTGGIRRRRPSRAAAPLMLSLLRALRFAGTSGV